MSDSGAGIADLDDNTVRGRVGTSFTQNNDAFAVGRRLNGVHQEIEDGL